MVALPSASCTHACGSFAPAWNSRAVRPLVVYEAEMSSRIGSPDVGMPAAIGLGVNTGVTPPNGATLHAFGSEQSSSATKPRSVMRFRYAARHAMWCARRMTTVPVPYVAAIVAAVSNARSVSHVPGRRWPSHACTAGREFTTVGAPSFAIVPFPISAR